MKAEWALLTELFAPNDAVLLHSASYIVGPCTVFETLNRRMQMCGDGKHPDLLVKIHYRLVGIASCAAKPDGGPQACSSIPVFPAVDLWAWSW